MRATACFLLVAVLTGCGSYVNAKRIKPTIDFLAKDHIRRIAEDESIDEVSKTIILREWASLQIVINEATSDE